MDLGPSDLVLCSGTFPRSAGFRQRLKAASRSAFSAISLWGRDYRVALEEGLSDADVASMLADHGLQVAELDPAWWWTPGAGHISIPPELDPVDVFRWGEAELFHIADVVQARSLNAVDVLGGDWTIEEGAMAFGALCDRAAEHGLLVHLEWLAWSRVPDLDTAMEIVLAADRPNGGVNIDTWHCARTGTTATQLLALPPGRVLAVQVNDGPREPEENLIEATLHDRWLPGRGGFDLVGYLGAIRAIGAPAPIGVEVFSDELHALGPTEAARLAATTTRAVLDCISGPGPTGQETKGSM